jgi:hypothetical protein
VCVEEGFARSAAAVHPRVGLEQQETVRLESEAQGFRSWFHETRLQAPNGIEPYLSEFAFYREFGPDDAEEALLRSLVRAERRPLPALRRVSRIRT